MDKDLQQTFLRVLALGQQIKERAGDEPLLPSEEIIRHMRQERAKYIQSLLEKSQGGSYVG